MLDNLALTILKIAFLLQAALFGVLASLCRDPDVYNDLEAHKMSNYMLFDNPEMLPEEYLKPVLNFIKILIIALPVIKVWEIVKPLMMQ